MRIFGDHEPRTIEQLQRCVSAADGSEGVLCADGHVGYSQPIGGVVAYREHLSPSGVGYDIGCIAAGERVLTADGYHCSIEQLGREHRPARPGADGILDPVTPYVGVIAKGRRPVRRLQLADGRALRLTGDHEVRTRLGWVRAEALTDRDRVLCPTFTGLPYEPCELSADFLALAGVINGDGHIPASPRYASVFTSVPEDALAVAAAVERETDGYRPPMYRRVRPNGSVEVNVRINHRELVRRLVGFGCPAGSKQGGWDSGLEERLLALPGWARARYLAAFAGAEGTTPRYAGRPVNLMLKQRGDDAMSVVTALMESLGFAWTVSEIAGMEVGQVVGGAEEQLRYLREVGFAFAHRKTAAAAAVVAAAHASATTRLDREAIRSRMRATCDAGATVQEAAAAVAAESGLTESTCIHLMYRRGKLRTPRGYVADAAVHGDCCWIAVRSVTPDGDAETFDVVTKDPQQAFVASGVTVHNCGNKAVLTNVSLNDVQPELSRIMDEISTRISFGVGRNDGRAGDHPVIDEIRDAAFAPQRKLRDLAAKQLGTVGAGNHYVDLFADEQNRVWIGVHFGSRGFGHKTASGFLALAQGLPFDGRASEGEMDSPPVLLHAGSELGAGYAEAMKLAGRYAYAGRDVVCAEVCRILGAEALEEVHNHHNYAWREEHGGESAWVVRKGATPAFPGQRGFVGATMGEPAVILEGVESDAAREALYSTVHGAGRAMSRTQAAGRRRPKWACTSCDWVQPPHTPKPDDCPRCGGVVKKRWMQISEGAIDFPTVQEELAAQGIELRGGAADEAPGAYKRLSEVLAYHEGTVRVLHTLRPIGVAMAGADTFDPYKD